MEILRAILVVVEFICSVLLILLVLLQKSKGEGLGMAFGAGVGETLFGSRAGNVLTRATIVLAVVFMANTLGLAMVYAGGQDKTLMERYSGAEGGADAIPAGAPGQRRMRQIDPSSPRQRTEPPASTATAPSGAPTLPGANLDDEMPMPMELPETIELPEVESIPMEFEAPAETDTVVEEDMPAGDEGAAMMTEEAPVEESAEPAAE